MMIEEVKKYDKDFSESGFITYVNNVFVQIKMGIVLKNLINVKHFVSPDVYETLERTVKDLNAKNITQMYDELNVHDTKILSFHKGIDKLIIEVNLISRILDYQVNKDGKIIKGNKESRKEENNYLTFTKKINAKKMGEMIKCPNCGATMEVNKTGRCPFCHSIFPLDEYSWILDNWRL